ncbi:MAG TPA: N-acetyltransferase [Blastocatellia bacterium]
MLPAAPNDTGVRVIPLADADPFDLDALFEEQRLEWMERLRWDYSAPSKILREVIRRRELLGYAAVVGSTTIGFSFYVLEDTRCSIGDIYVSRDWRESGADGKMVLDLLEAIRPLSRIRRIECQGPAFDNSGADRVFRSFGFSAFERHFMIASLSVADAQGHTESMVPPSNVSLEVELRPWDEKDFSAAARVIYRSYKGSIDRDVNILYATEEGCADLLSILTDSIWCGKFLQDVSSVAVSGRPGNLVGLLIATSIAADVGHIGQISVAPGYQGRGVARGMMTAALSRLAAEGYSAASLVVTAENTRALDLYKGTGFRTIHSFPVYCRQQR